MISVIVPFHDAEQYLGDCLDAVLGQDMPPGSYEVIAIDNASRDSSVEIARSRPAVKLHFEPDQGAYAARNRGLEVAGGELIAFTDADCVPRSDWLRRLHECMDQYPGTHVVMGRDIPTGPSRAIRLLGLYDHAKETFVLASDDPTVYYGHTNCMLARRETLETLGGFDRRPRGADVIFVQRALQRYGTESVRYQPDAVVNHLEVCSAPVYFKKAFIYGRSARSYQRVVNARPLRNRERLGIFRETVRGNSLSIIDSAYLLCLLSAGVVAYALGWLSPRSSGASAAGSRPVDAKR
jgi:glycosyltransferase involved in cell wall biosynthesis